MFVWKYGKGFAETLDMKVLRRTFNIRKIYGLAVVICLWEIIHFIVNSKIVPGPYETAKAFLGLLSGNLVLHILSSLFRVLSAISVSAAAGVPLGLLTGMSRKADSFISPVMYILYPIPKIAFLPVFMILFGLGNSSKIVLVTSIIIFQIMLSARDGVREIPQEFYYSARSLGLSMFQIYMHIVVPAVLPKLFSAMRISMGMCIAALFFSENFSTTFGIGYFIMNCWVMADYLHMFAGILALSLMGMLMFKVIDYAEKKLCPWLHLDS
ncbi:MAG: ABC transporter permease [Bacillota bacterium]|nr:ABC transporter permease [Bacillota bacterium]